MPDLVAVKLEAVIELAESVGIDDSSNKLTGYPSGRAPFINRGSGFDSDFLFLQKVVA